MHCSFININSFSFFFIFLGWLPLNQVMSGIGLCFVFSLSPCNYSQTFPKYSCIFPKIHSQNTLIFLPTNKLSDVLSNETFYFSNLWVVYIFFFRFDVHYKCTFNTVKCTSFSQGFTDIDVYKSLCCSEMIIHDI